MKRQVVIPSINILSGDLNFLVHKSNSSILAVRNGYLNGRN